MFISISILSFLVFTSLVGFLTYVLTRKDDHDSSTGYFLAGRSLSFPLIAGSLLLTNLSTEQLVGLNGKAFADGLCVMVWEVVCVIALVFMAWFFLPRFLKSGVATVPEYLRIRFGESTQWITNLMFLLAYVGLLLPIILYSGAKGMIAILDIEGLVTPLAESINVDPATLALWIIVWAVGLLGSVYALFGGLRTVAVSDTINGIGLFVGGFLITGFSLSLLGQGDWLAGCSRLYEEQSQRFNSIGDAETSVPFWTIFSGIFLLNLFYWTTNQQIIQRTLGASSLAEGQKGVLLTGALKLLGPLYLVIPGMIAYSVFAGQEMEADDAYGKLVREVLPSWLSGFFAAVMIGAILSSFNSALNSACTLFSLGFYGAAGQRVEDASPEAETPTSEFDSVRAGKIFGWMIAVVSMMIAPWLAKAGKDLFDILQTMNGLYFIPIFAVVLVGMLTRRVPAFAANVALVGGFVVLAAGYFVPQLNPIVKAMLDYQFLGVVFAWLVVLMLVLGELYPRETEFVQEDVGAVDMTPWRLAKPAGCVLIAIVITIYVCLADVSVLKKEPEEPLEAATTSEPQAWRKPPVPLDNVLFCEDRLGAGARPVA